MNGGSGSPVLLPRRKRLDPLLFPSSFHGFGDTFRGLGQYSTASVQQAYSCGTIFFVSRFLVHN